MHITEIKSPFIVSCPFPHFVSCPFLHSVSCPFRRIPSANIVPAPKCGSCPAPFRILCSVHSAIFHPPTLRYYSAPLYPQIPAENPPSKKLEKLLWIFSGGVLLLSFVNFE